MLLSVPHEADRSSRQGREFTLLSQTLIAPSVSQASILLKFARNWEMHSDGKN